MRDFADCLRLRPPVELLCRSIPERDYIVHIADEHCVVREVKKTRLFTQRNLRRLILQREVSGECNNKDTDNKVGKGNG